MNKEVTELINGVINATKKLKPGGKILVVSFHSIEDRIVKYFFSNYSKNKSRPQDICLKINLMKQFYLMNIKIKCYALQKRNIPKYSITICQTEICN